MLIDPFGKFPHYMQLLLDSDTTRFTVKHHDYIYEQKLHL